MKSIQKTLLTFLLVAIASFTFAQNNFGFRAGLQYADVSVPTIQSSLNINPKTINRFEIAAFYEYNFNDNFSIRPELSYNKKGFSVNEGIDFEVANLPLPIGVEAITEIQYIQMPVFGKYAFGTGTARAYIMAGPSIGYAMDARLKTRVNSIIDFNISNSDINLNNDTYDRIDLAGVAGAGVELMMNNGSLFVEGRYTHSFSDLLQDPIIDLKLRNKSFGLSAGYKFKF